MVVVVGVMGFAGSATAQSPVAVVEEVQGNVTGAEFMDYVVPGKVIKLGQGASIVVGYMKSCRRETINGVGTVNGVVGTPLPPKQGKQSEVGVKTAFFDKNIVGTANAFAGGWGNLGYASQRALLGRVPC